MSAASLLASLTLRGISVRADGDRLLFEPGSAVTDAERANLKAEKPAILQLVRIMGSATATDALGAAVEIIRQVEEAEAGLYLRPEHGLSLWHGERVSNGLLIRLVQHHDQIERLVRWRYSSGLDDVALVGETNEQTTANFIAEAERCGAAFSVSATQGVEVDSPPVWAVNPPTEYLAHLLRALDRTWDQVEVAIRRRSAPERDPDPLTSAPEIDGGRLQDKRSAVVCDQPEALRPSVTQEWLDHAETAIRSRCVLGTWLWYGNALGYFAPTDWAERWPGFGRCSACKVEIRAHREDEALDYFRDHVIAEHPDSDSTVISHAGNPPNPLTVQFYVPPHIPRRGIAHYTSNGKQCEYRYDLDAGPISEGCIEYLTTLYPPHQTENWRNAA